MTILNNLEIREMLERQTGLVDIETPKDLTETNCPIRPASIDLTVGKIYIPPRIDDHRVRVEEDFYDLKPGAAVLVETGERLKLPSDLAGLMFPKSGDFAMKGILVTNFGHVDPGYDGPLRYTIMNLGSSDFRLTVGQKIACLILFRLTTGANPSWKDGHRSSTRAHARVLNREFLNLTDRIDKTVIKAVSHRDRLALWGPLSAGLMSLFLAGLGIYFGIFQPMNSEITQLKVSIGRLEEDIRLLNPKQQLNIQE
jgi:deoxycytidine triphosphate deaminase